jgi:radical SAM superfamily enzyme YgiQ (UPF0313 family)
VVAGIPRDASLVFIYGINIASHVATTQLIRAVKAARPSLPLVAVENTQAVTSYALMQVAEDFYNAGADYILTGEAELRGPQLAAALIDGDREDRLAAIDGLGMPGHYVPPGQVIEQLDDMPFPAWDLFPLQNYWDLQFSHGPLESSRYLPLLTSRGCPYGCKFCVAPATNRRQWRPRSAKNVVDEMEQYHRRFLVNEFHIEDLNPTVSDARIREICHEILDRRLRVIWKIAAGTKVEGIRHESTLDLMAAAGCRYISISPESGSASVLKKMGKPFDLAHAVRLIRRMNQVGIRSQACFVLGFPGETAQDLRQTWDMVQELTHLGVDEIALFIITPVPGSEIYPELEGYQSLSELNFTPTWREDYARLNRFRLNLYVHFLIWKLRYHPKKILRQILNFFARRFETKMEMVPFKAIFYKMIDNRIIS